VAAVLWVRAPRRADAVTEPVESGLGAEAAS
jgi:hypothetical protein